MLVGNDRFWRFLVPVTIVFREIIQQHTEWLALLLASPRLYVRMAKCVDHPYILNKKNKHYVLANLSEIFNEYHKINTEYSIFYITK